MSGRWEVCERGEELACTIQTLLVYTETAQENRTTVSGQQEREEERQLGGTEGSQGLVEEDRSMTEERPLQRGKSMTKLSPPTDLPILYSLLLLLPLRLPPPFVLPFLPPPIPSPPPLPSPPLSSPPLSSPPHPL